MRGFLCEVNIMLLFSLQDNDIIMIYYIVKSRRIIMSIIRPSSELRNNYSEISEICHETNEPVYL